MTRATLSEVLRPALGEGYALAGLVCLGWEDARAYRDAAEAEGLPIILQAGPSCRANTPLPVLGRMFSALAEEASVPVVIHLDHGASRQDCEAAIAEGFTSVMYDGSRLPLEENIAKTAEIAELAHRAGVSCEGEIGFVGYSGGEASAGTDPDEAARFARETGVDAMAVSVGNVHLQTEAGPGIDRARLQAINALCDVPLVIHGGSGVPGAERRALAQETSVCKFNIGTELRMGFARALRDTLTGDKALFDRIDIFKAVETSLVRQARPILRNLAR